MNEQYNLLAEFGRVDGQTVYLARDRATGEVAIARRRSDDPSGPLTISHALDATVPADGAVCSFCMDDLRTWGRFCPSCGREVFGAQPTSPDSPSPDQLLDAVRHAAEGRFDILGSMPRAEGGDTIYFAVDLNTADVVALLLNREGIEADGTLAYSLELPLTLSPVAKGPAAAAAATPAPPPPPKADSFTAFRRRWSRPYRRVRHSERCRQRHTYQTECQNERAGRLRPFPSPLRRSFRPRRRASARRCPRESSSPESRQYSG
jgi:hypothetical protein